MRRLCAVFGPTLFSVGDADSVQDAPNDVVPNRRQIPNPSTPNEYNGVFLKIVSFARDVCCDLHPVREADAGDLP